MSKRSRRVIMQAGVIAGALGTGCIRLAAPGAVGFVLIDLWERAMTSVQIGVRKLVLPALLAVGGAFPLGRKGALAAEETAGGGLLGQHLSVGVGDDRPHVRDGREPVLYLLERGKVQEVRQAQVVGVGLRVSHGRAANDNEPSRRWAAFGRPVLLAAVAALGGLIAGLLLH